MKCNFCTQPIEDRRFYQLVQGWERPGKGSGGQSGSSLVMREHVQQFAHEDCITRKRGLRSR